MSYEGTAQYPDTPQGYVASPYGPPEPVRQADKFKRQLKLDEQVRLSRNRVPKQIKDSDQQLNTKDIFKVSSKVDDIKSKFDLLVAPSETVAVREKKKKFQVVNRARTDLKKEDFNPTEIKADKSKGERNFYETEHEPQAEPLSLQQSPPKAKKEVRNKQTDRATLPEIRDYTTPAEVTEKMKYTSTTPKATLLPTESSVINWQNYASNIVIKDASHHVPVIDIEIKDASESPEIIEFDLFNEVFDELEEKEELKAKPKRNIYTYELNEDSQKSDTFYKLKAANVGTPELYVRPEQDTSLKVKATSFVASETLSHHQGRAKPKRYIHSNQFVEKNPEKRYIITNK